MARRRRPLRSWKRSRWKWMGQLPPRELEQVARSLLTLIGSQEKWVHRRIETISLVDERVIRRDLTVDFSLPEGLPPPWTRDGRDVHLVPLTFLRREPGPMSYDLRDEAGRSMALLNAAEYSRISAAVLYQAATRELKRKPDSALARTLIQLPYLVWPRSLGHLRALLNPASVEWRRYRGKHWMRCVLGDRPEFVDLLCLLAEHNIAVVPVTGEAGTRRVVKLGFEEVVEWGRRGLLPWPLQPGFGLKTWALRVRVPGIGGCDSQHFQLLAPPNVEFTGAAALGRTPYCAMHHPIFGTDAKPRDSDYVVLAKGHANRLHLYQPGAHQHQVGVVALPMRAERRGLLASSIAAAAVIAAALTAFAIFTSDLVRSDRSTVPLLLLTPGLVVAILVRPGEHAMARTLLRPTRVLLIAAAGLAVAAAVLALALAPESHDVLRLVPAKALTFRSASEAEAPSGALQLALSGLAGAAWLIAFVLWLGLFFPRARSPRPPRPDG